MHVSKGIIEVNKSILKRVYKKRDPWSYKGQYGRLLCIVGNEWNTGSPIFVGMAAYRAGCDLVFLTGPERAMDVAANYSPLLITKPLDGKQLDDKHIPDILEFLEKVKPTAVVIGNGLWRADETKKAIVKLIEKIDLPMVIDADAIRAMSMKKEVLRTKNCLLTPHDNEFLELTGMKVSRTNLNDRIRTTKEQAKKLSTTLVLKGRIDIITDGKKLALNRTGSPKMSVGGMGDTLAGICGALLARKIDTFTAGCATAYINGRAGEVAAKRFKESVLATDLINCIANVIA